ALPERTDRNCYRPNPRDWIDLAGRNGLVVDRTLRHIDAEDFIAVEVHHSAIIHNMCQQKLQSTWTELQILQNLPVIRSNGGGLGQSTAHRTRNSVFITVPENA